MAILNEDVEEGVKKLKCRSRAMASNFNCSVDAMACSCHPADHTISCVCQENKDIAKIFGLENSLPFEHNGLLFESENGMVIAQPDLTSAQIQMSLKGMKLKTEIQINNCKLIAGNLTGCHDCERGAELKLTCFTDFGNTLANIICPSAKTFAACSPKGREKIVSLHFSNAEIREECEVFCGSSTSRFQLQGQLDHPDESGGSSWALANRTWIEEWRDVDFKRLFGYLAVPRLILICLFSLFSIFLIFYCLLPFFIRIIISYFLKLFLSRSVVNDHVKIV